MASASGKVLRVAIDTGGTFTDCVWVEGRTLKTLKVFSTPDDPSRAIAEALRKIGSGAGVILLHGTTVGTNSLLQRKGARVALLTTSGFEDVIEIGRQARPKLYDFFFDRIEPLVPSEMRIGVKERTDAEGHILESLTPEEVTRVQKAVREARPEAIAISFLFSFANSTNEAETAKALETVGKPLSVSHKILPEFREYERTSTVVVNAYLQPLMQSYLEQLSERLRKLTSQAGEKQQARIFVMQSSGGITAVESAAREPVRTVLSGPAGGLVGAAAMAKRSRLVNILSFDMGGTSTDVALIQGQARPGAQSEVAGFPVGVPMLDIHTVGAGGGSLARFDSAGALRVGPESAGADPGPICYGRGTQPTVTDASLLLGRLRPDRFLGAEFRLDLERTRSITAQWLKEQGSRLSLEEFAAGVIRVVNANMERALRVVSIERGYDPRAFALVAFGGAGGLHACELAEALAIPTVVLPSHPGALSAFGILSSDVVKDFSRTLRWKVSTVGAAQITAEFRKLEIDAKREFKAEGWRGAPVLEHSIDLRYRGQGYELNVAAGAKIEQRFHKEHQRRYGYNHPSREIELVTLRLRASLKASQPRISASHNRSGHAQRLTNADRAQVFFNGRSLTTPIYERSSLLTGRSFTGPAVITEYSATTVIPPKKRFWCDRTANLLIEI